MFRLLGGSQKSGVGDVVLGSLILMSPEKYFGLALNTHPHFQTISFCEVRELYNASHAFLWSNCHMLYIWNLNFWSVWRYCQSKSCLPIYYTITNASLRSGSVPDLLSWVLKHLLNKTYTMSTLFRIATCTNYFHTHSCTHTHHTYYFYISKHAFLFNIKHHLVNCHLLLVSLL